jgi:hypothetical protein
MWLIDDAAIAKKLALQNGRMNAGLVRSIAKAYGVSRTLKGAPKKPKKGKKSPTPDPTATLFAERLNRLAESNISSLTQRSKLYLQSARKCFRSVGIKGRPPYSAISKLIWFMKPTDWTMFDKWAAAAVGVKSGSAAEKFERFYSRIGSLGFSATAAAIARKLEAQNLSGLSGERVVDKFLMFAAWPEEQRVAQAAHNDIWLTILPSELGSSVKQAAESVERLEEVVAFQRGLLDQAWRNNGKKAKT